MAVLRKRTSFVVANLPTPSDIATNTLTTTMKTHIQPLSDLPILTIDPAKKKQSGMMNVATLATEFTFARLPIMKPIRSRARA